MSLQPALQRLERPRTRLQRRVPPEQPLLKAQGTQAQNVSIIPQEERGPQRARCAADDAMTTLENLVAEAEQIQSDTNGTLESNLPVEPSTAR